MVGCKKEQIMDIRKPKEDDQEMAEEAFQLIVNLVERNPWIDANQWISGCMTAVSNTFIQNGASFQEFEGCMKDAIRFYKKEWDKS